ncbi:unnamed protein product [Rhizopus microsporus]
MDGLAYDLYRNERVAFEGSSGEYKANINKIVDDSTKQVSTMIAMLKGIGNRHLNANFKTLLDTEVFGIQSVRTSIVLSEVQFKEDDRFSYREVRSAEVPIVYEERNKWLKVFEILCYMLVELKKQRINYKVIEDDEQGAVLVMSEDTIKSKIK